MRIRLAVFDMDGTILDTAEDLWYALNHALEVNGLPPRTLPETRMMIGNGIRKLVERGVPEETDSVMTDKVYEAFGTYYRKHNTERTCPYPGIPELLDRLKLEGIQVAVVSNKDDDAVKHLAEYYFPTVFDAAIGSRPNVQRKPAPDTVELALDMLGTAKENTVYIGDSDVDIETARNAHIPCVAVTWGLRDEAFLRAYDPEYIASSPEKVWEIINRI